MRPAILIDSNLLLLLVVGWASRDYIGKHKRLSQYGKMDFDTLIRIIKGFDEVVVVAHALTETSNLICHVREPLKSILMDKMRMFVRETREAGVASLEGVDQPEFNALGLTDAVLLALSAPGRHAPPALLTHDRDLAIAAKMRGHRILNFEDFRLLG